MEFGMFHQFPVVPGGSETDAFAQAFEQVDAAERHGLDAMWLAELHVDPARSVLAAPVTIASAIAARTERIKIGIAVQVLPLCHPLRIAEEAATVDQISRGRLIFGVGRSGLPRTYEAYGIPYAESKDRFAETLHVIEQAWSTPRFSHEGQYFNFDNVAVTPKPFQKPLPPIRVAASSPDTFPAIGKLGYPIFVMPRGTFSDMLPAIESYREASRGRPRGAWKGLSAGAALCRRDCGAGARGARAEHHAFLPRAGGAAQGLGEPGRHIGQRGPGRARRDARHPHLRGCDPRQDHHRRARTGGRAIACATGGAGARRYPRRTQHRRANPA